MFKLLIGEDVDLFTFESPRLFADVWVDFNSVDELKKRFNEDVIEVLDDLGVLPKLEVEGDLEFDAQFNMGFDTYGIRKAFTTGFENPLDVFDGFYIGDTRAQAFRTYKNPFDANIGGGSGNYYDPDKQIFDGPVADTPEFYIDGSLDISGDFKALGVFKFNPGGGVNFHASVDFVDPNQDGKVRGSEIARIIDRYDNGFLDLFNVSAKLDGHVKAAVSILDAGGSIGNLFKGELKAEWKEIFNKRWDFDLIDFYHDSPADDQPILGTLESNGTLILHMGDRAIDRVAGDVSDGNEVFTVRHIGGSAGSETIEVGFDGFVEEFQGVKRIVGDGGKGNDTIELKGILSDAELSGNVGNDTITADDRTSGNLVIRGDGGNDTLVGGLGNDTFLFEDGFGSDQITDEAGETTLDFSAMTVGVDGTVSQDGLTIKQRVNQNGKPNQVTASGNATIATLKTIILGSGDDALALGQNTVGRSLTIDGTDGSDRLAVDDHGTSQGELTDREITGLGMGGTIEYANLEDLEITLASGDDSFTVKTTHAGQTTLNTGDGSDTITIENTGIDALTVLSTGNDADEVIVNMVSGETRIQTANGTDSVHVEGTDARTQIDTGAANDVVDIISIGDVATVSLGDGYDIVNVGNHDDRVDDIAAKLSIDGGLGADSLNLNDGGDTEDNSGVLTASRINGLGMAGAGIDYTNLERLETTLGAGNDTFTIVSTHTNLTYINSADGADTINVETIDGQTNIRTHIGNDIINVGNPEQLTNQIGARLSLKGGMGSDILNVDNSGDRHNNSGVLTDSMIKGLGMAAYLGYSTMEQVNIALGQGADRFTLESTHRMTTNVDAGGGTDTLDVVTISGNTTVSGGQGNDIINVGSFDGLLEGINARLSVKGTTGADIMNVDNAGDTADNIGLLTDSAITGLGMGGWITYSTLEQLNLKLGAGHDTLTVESTHTEYTNISTASGNDTILVETVSGETVINTDTGNDRVDVSDPNQLLDRIDAPLTIKGGAGRDRLFVNDFGDRSDNTGTLTDNRIAGLDMRGWIDYGTMELLQLKLGQGHDALMVNSTHQGDTYLLTAAGDDVVDVQSIVGYTNVRSHAGRDSIMVGSPAGLLDGINSQLVVNTGGGGDRLTVLDSEDTVEDTGHLTDTQLTGLGMDGWIDYSNVENLDIRLGAGHDAFTIESTHHRNTIIRGGWGDDTINVQSISGRTMLTTQAGKDVINVGNTAQMLDDIRAELMLKGGGGSDILNLNDAGDTSDNLGLVTDRFLSGFGMADAIGYDSLESLNLKLGTGNDTLTVESTPNNGQATHFDLSDGNDKVNIEGVSSETNLQAGAGDDIVQVGSAHQQLDQIAGLLILKGGFGDDQLTIDNAGDTRANEGSLTENQLTGLSMTEGIGYGSFEALSIRLGAGAERFTVKGTHTSPTHLDLGAGDDDLRLEAVGGEATIQAGAGNDTMMVSSATGQLDTLTHEVTLVGGAGDDRLTVSNAGDGRDRQGRLSDTEIRGLGMAGHLVYSSVEALALTLGEGTDDFTVEKLVQANLELATAAGDDQVSIEAISREAIISTDAGDDRIRIGGSTRQLNGIQAALTIKGGLGADILDLDDSGDETNNTGTLSDTQVTGLGLSQALNYGSLEAVNLKLGAGSDTFTIQGTPSDVANLETGDGQDQVRIEAAVGTTTVETGNGDDQIEVGNASQRVDQINAPVLIKGGLGVDFLTVNNSGATADTDGTLSDVEITGLDISGKVTYGSMEGLAIALGTGHDRFTIFSTHTGQTRLMTNAGNDTVWVEAIAGKTSIEIDAEDRVLALGGGSSSEDTATTSGSAAAAPPTEGDGQDTFDDPLEAPLAQPLWPDLELVSSR